ncbi:hypothetical protein BsWGS_15187 [Bradybaena similaris]
MEQTETVEVLLSGINYSAGTGSDVRGNTGINYSTGTGSDVRGNTGSNHSTGSNEIEYKVAEVMWQVCPVILFLFGTFGNIFILMMLRTLRLGRTSMHVYLRALAISDLCVLYTGLLRWWIFWTFGMDIRDKHILVCKGHTWLLYVSLYVSAWLLVFMTLERTFSACVPHRVNMFCTKRRACCLIVFIVVFQACMQSHFLFGMTLQYSDEKNTQECQPSAGDYNTFVHDIYPFVDLVLLSLIPFVCVILGNVIIIWKTFLSLKTAAELNLTSEKGATLRRRRASSMTLILICLSTLFLLTTSPTCVYNMWERGETAKAAMKTSIGVARTELAWASVNIIMYCNNTFNFYLYCLSGRKFRNEIKQQFSRRRTDSQSVMCSAVSIQLHRCSQNEQRYSRHSDKPGGSPSSRENNNGINNHKQLTNGAYGGTDSGTCCLLYGTSHKNNVYL